MRILLVRLSAIGDCLHALPVLNALRDQLPEAYLGWAIQAESHRLLSDHAAVDRFHLYPRRERGALGHARALWRFRRELRLDRYDIALDLQGLTKSGLVAWWSNAPLRIGFRGEQSRELNALFLNRRIAPPEAARHVVDRNLSLLRALDLGVPDEVDWSLPSTEPGNRLRGFLNGLGSLPYVVVNAGTTWPTKRWPVECFAELVTAIAARGDVQVVVTWGSSGEERDADRIVAHDESERVTKAPATSLQELQTLIAGSRLFVGNDTGPMHLAVALGVPVVALFGASDPVRNGPYPALWLASNDDSSASLRGRIRSSAVLSAPIELECRPCRKSRCARGDLACLRQLPVVTVLAACAERLGGGGSQTG
jgi:lipopolysaccharide heptosyltransferase I